MSENNKDVEHLAALVSAALTLFIMANAIEGYFERVYTYFYYRFAPEIAYLATLSTYALGAGIAYKFFKIVLTAIFLGMLVFGGVTGSPLRLFGI